MSGQPDLAGHHRVSGEDARRASAAAVATQKFVEAAQPVVRVADQQTGRRGRYQVFIGKLASNESYANGGGCYAHPFVA